MFQRNEALLKQYNDQNPKSEETLVDLGVIPADTQVRVEWSAEASRFLSTLASKGYHFQPAMVDGDSGLCPLYIVRLDRGDFRGPTPVDLSYFRWTVQRLWCYPGQTVEIRETILEINVLGNGEPLEEIVTQH